MTKSSIHRALTTLSVHGLVEQDPVTRRYRLGIRLFEIGAAAIHQRGLHGAAHPALVELATATGEACHLAVLSRTEAVYIYKIDGTSNFSMTSRVGGRAPTHCTSFGKVLLAWGSTRLLRRLVDGGEGQGAALGLLAQGGFHVVPQVVGRADVGRGPAPEFRVLRDLPQCRVMLHRHRLEADVLALEGDRGHGHGGAFGGHGRASHA